MEKPPALSAEETAQALGDTPPPPLTAEETHFQLSDTPPPALSAQDTERAIMDANMSGQHSDALAQGLQGTDSVNALQAANTLDAASEFYGKENGWLENAFYTMTMAEQFVARQAVNVIENLGMMSTEDAREILSRDQVHGSDIVNFYWRDPATTVGKAGRFVTGLAADILLDPLSYVGVGALTQAAKTATIGGKAVKLGKLSRAERHYYKTLEQVEKVLTADGKFLSQTDDALTVMEQNQKALARARDSQISIRDMNENISTLQSELNVTSHSKENLLSTIREGLTEKSWADEWREGSRGLTFGARVPFSDMALEFDVPGPLSKLIGMPVRALDATFGLVKSTLRQTEWGDAAFNLLSDLGSNTGKFLFDVEQNTRLGSKSQLDDHLAKFKTNARTLITQMKASMPEGQFIKATEDILAELESPMIDLDEATRLAEVFGKSADDAENLVLRSNTVEAFERRARLEANPALMDFVDDMKQMQANMAQQFKSRGLPFEELNPFGEGWATGYAKHVFTKQFIDKVREMKQASGAVEQAMMDFPQLMGRADSSSKARKFRAPIQELNAAALEKHGVKMFVDDPVELVSMRMQEMHKLIVDHDLMESASKYAVVGKNPGKGYVKFNPDHFKRLSQDESDQFQAKWDMFIPKFFKQTDDKFVEVAQKMPDTTPLMDDLGITMDDVVQSEAKMLGKSPDEIIGTTHQKQKGRDIYLPEDVYARMNFAINGWDMSSPLAKFLNAADLYTNVWRNNALFGPGYIGLNAFSNALTYLSLNDRGGPMAIAKATAALMPETIVGRGIDKVSGLAKATRDQVMIKVPSLTKEQIAGLRGVDVSEVTELALTPQELLKWAHEDNLLNSSFVKGVEWSKMTEHVASNREARKILGIDPKTAVDHAFLWRYSRGMAQFADDIPKLATYISFLEKGFSRGAAAEYAERYFYNFNKTGKVQAGIAKAIPFSSFPMKTAEMVIDQAKDGKLAAFTIPGKVNAALDGAFVQDHETRGALDQMLPGYKNVLHPIHGELMPGMRELVIDIPWTYATMNTIFHPEKANHPVAQLLMLAGSLNSGDEEALAEGERQREVLYAQNIDLVIPSWLRESLTLAEINGSIDLGGFFKDRYLPTLPTRSQEERAMSGRQTLDEGTMFQKFNNAAEFGAAVEKKYGESWLYNLFFHNRVDVDGDLLQQQELGMRGEYIRKRMRQFTLGLATMNKLDSNFFMNTAAIKRQISIKKNRLKHEIVQGGVLMDTEALNEKGLDKIKDQYPLAKEILALEYKKQALTEYYNFFLEAEKKAPELNLIKVLTGADEYEFDYGDEPEKEVYEKLYKRKTMNNIPDDEAEDLIDGIYSEEAR